MSPGIERRLGADGCSVGVIRYSGVTRHSGQARTAQNAGSVGRVEGFDPFDDRYSVRVDLPSVNSTHDRSERRLPGPRRAVSLM
jgi:hypothetical protein